MQEHIVLFTEITPQDWEEIKQIAQEYDVESGDSPDHVFDVRDDYVLVWGRDGWREGFFHACLRWHPEEKHVRMTRGESPRCMSLHSARKLLTPLLTTSE